MAEQQICHRKSCLVLSARFPVVKWRSRPVAKSDYYWTDVRQHVLYNEKRYSMWNIIASCLFAYVLAC